MDRRTHFADPLEPRERQRAKSPTGRFKTRPAGLNGSTSKLWIVGGLLVPVLAILSASAGAYKLSEVLLGLTALVGAILAIRVCISDPSWLLFALVLEEVLPYLNIIPLDPDTRWVLRYPMLLPLTIPAGWYAFRSGTFRRGWFKAYSLFLGWCAVTVCYSALPVVSLGRLLPVALLFGALLVIADSVKSADDVQTLLGRFVLGCGLLMAMVAVSLVSFPSALSWTEEQGLLRFSGIFLAPNELGALAMCTIIGGIAHWNATEGWRRYLLGVTILAAIIFGAMADSRTVFLAILAGLFGYVIWKYRVRGVLTALLAIGVVFVCLKALAPEYLDRDIATMTGRSEAWSFELIKLKQAPLIGYGYDIEGEIFQDRHFTNWEIFWDAGPNTPLHNGYLSLAIGVGIPAAVAWLIIIMTPWVKLLRDGEDTWKLKPLFFFVVIPMLVLGAQESGLGEPRYLKGILFFLCWMLVERRRQLQAGIAQAAEQEKIRVSPLVSALSAGLVGIAVIMSAPADARAANYYVDSASGRDSNRGTSESAPWRTLDRVNHYPLEAGDVVHLKRNGIWRETLTPEGPGDSNFRGVTFGAYGSGGSPLRPDPPTINGSDPVNRWTPEAGGLYSSRQNRRVYNVFVNQSPGWGLKHACCLPGTVCAAASPDDPDRGHTCGIGPMQAGSWYWSGDSTAGHGRRHTLYVWPNDGRMPASNSVEAVTRPFGFHGWTRAKALDGVVLDGLRIIQTGERAISLESEDAAGCCGSRGVGSGSGIKGLVIRNCVVARTGTGRVDDGSYANAISIINATAPLIEHNTVSYAGNHGNAIEVQNANGARVIGNLVEHWNHNGIDIKGSRDVLVESNEARDQPEIGAGFYTEYSSNVIFARNRALRVSNGFQISQGASAIVLQNNVDDAGTGVYFGPQAVAATLQDNVARTTAVVLAGDGSGALRQVSNDWGAKPRFQLPGLR